MKTLHKVAIGLAVVALLYYGWAFLAGRGRGLSPAKLAELAANADTLTARQQAAVDLAGTGADGRPYLRELLHQGPDPGVRAACAQALGHQGDYDSVDALIQSLEDDSLPVRVQSAAALSRLLQRDVRFPANDRTEVRAAAVARIKQTWQDLCDWSAVQYLKQGISLDYFYDRNTGKLFEGPARSPGPIAAPSGDLRGAPAGTPAGVRAHVYAYGSGADEQRFVYLSIPESALQQEGAALPPRETPEGDKERSLVCRPGDAAWVYGNSPAGRALIASLRTLAAGRGQVKVCRPGP